MSQISPFTPCRVANWILVPHLATLARKNTCRQDKIPWKSPLPKKEWLKLFHTILKCFYFWCEILSSGCFFLPMWHFLRPKICLSPTRGHQDSVPSLWILEVRWRAGKTLPVNIGELPGFAKDFFLSKIRFLLPSQQGTWDQSPRKVFWEGKSQI